MKSDRVIATMKLYGKEREEPSKVNGTVIFENNSYRTIQTKNYRTSINKYDELIGEATVRVL